MSSRALNLPSGPVPVAGFAKGAAMIGPNMATMLGFVLTDAAVGETDLHAVLKAACDATFNCISVEGHTSTNDTVLLLANGAGPRLAGHELADVPTRPCTRSAPTSPGRSPPTPRGPSTSSPSTWKGCRTDADARQIAKAVADSALVKTAVFGADPNWGRVVSAAGYAGVAFEEKDLSLWMGDMLLYRAGVPLPFDAAAGVGVSEAQPRGPLPPALHARHRPLHLLHQRPDPRVREAERGLHDVMQGPR